MANTLPPPPINDSPGSFTWLEWYRQLRNYISQSGSVPWSVIDFGGSNLADLTTRNHNQLQVIQGGTVGQYYHMTKAQYNTMVANLHNSMTGFQGGTTNEYYHLTSSQNTKLGTLTSNWNQTPPSTAANASGDSPTKAEFDALVTEVNALRQILRNNGICS